MRSKQSVPMFKNMYLNPDRRPIKHNLRYNDLEHLDTERLGESVFGGDLKLKEIIAGHYGVKPTNVALIEGGGSNANFHVFYTLLEQGDRVLVENPSYEPLFCIPERLGAEVIRFGRSFENRFQPNLEDIVSRIDERTRMIVMTNTHYGSGIKLREDILSELIKIAEQREIYLFFDEAYHDPFVDKEIRPIARLTEQGISTYSLSKMYGLSTLRFGLVVSNEDVTNQIMGSLFTTEVNNSGLLNKEWNNFFRDIKKHAKRSREIRRTNLDLLEQAFKERGIEYLKPDSGTCCAFKLDGVEASRFSERCIDEFGLKIGYQPQFGNVMFVAFGSDPRKFSENLDVLCKAIDRHRQ